MINKLAPVVLFTYNRPQHLSQTIEALARNEFASECDIIFYSDGPKDSSDKNQVGLVRSLIYSRADSKDFKSVTVIEREKNMGLAASIISGVTEIVNRSGRIIVLEDDLITSPYFLRYMNDALEIYKSHSDVASIHGYVYPVRAELPETYFIRGADCWGWATWAHAWKDFEPDGQILMNEIRKKSLIRKFNLDGGYDYWGMLKDQVEGRNNSWAIRWHASVFVKGKFTLWPGKTLVSNIGFDASGTHCDPTENYDVQISPQPVNVRKVPVIESEFARNEFAHFFRKQRPSIFDRIKKTLKIK